MAELNIKKQFYNEKGELETLKIYTTQTEVGTPYKKLTLNIDGENIIGYIGLTDEIDTPKVSSNKVIIDGKEYRERKYVGIKSFNDYMKINYPETYQTIQYLPKDFPDTSDATSLYLCFNGCNELLEIDDRVDTRNITSMGAYAFGGSKIEKIPLLDLSKCTSISYGFSKSGIFNLECKNTEKISGYQSMCQGCNRLISIKGFNTRSGNNFGAMLYGCNSLQEIMPIDLSSVMFEKIDSIFGKNMLTFCNSLPSITFNNVPAGVTEEQLRTATGAPETCKIIINHREIKEHTPIRIIKAENMKLVDIDVNGDMPIVREGNKPLDNYIVNSGDWGTIYDDGANFKCFVTSNNEIYLGKAYNSSTATELHPKIPEGVEIPEPHFILSKTNKETFINNSFIFTDVLTHNHNEYTQRYFCQVWGGQWIEFYYPEGGKNDLCFSYLNWLEPITNSRGGWGGVFNNSIFKINESSQYDKPYTTTGIYIYEGQLFAEELEIELSKIKTKILSVTRDETNQDPALEFSIKEGVL